MGYYCYIILTVLRLLPAVLKQYVRRNMCGKSELRFGAMRFIEHRKGQTADASDYVRYAAIAVEKKKQIISAQIKTDVPQSSTGQLRRRHALQRA